MTKRKFFIILCAIACVCAGIDAVHNYLYNDNHGLLFNLFCLAINAIYLGWWIKTPEKEEE